MDLVDGVAVDDPVVRDGPLPALAVQCGASGSGPWSPYDAVHHRTALSARDLDLLGRAPVRLVRPLAPHHERGLAGVHRCARAEAVVVKSLLESASIPALLRSRLAHSAHPFAVGDQGEDRRPRTGR